MLNARFPDLKSSGPPMCRPPARRPSGAASRLFRLLQKAERGRRADLLRSVPSRPMTRTLLLGLTSPPRSKYTCFSFFSYSFAGFADDLIAWFSRFKKVVPLKTKALAVRKKTSPAVSPPTPPASTPMSSEQGLSDTSKPAEPSRSRAQVTPADEWTTLTGKVSMPPLADRAEATANDAPILPPVKEEAFDEEGPIKPDFQD